MTALFERNSDDLLRYFARRVFDGQSAIDLVGETFARAVESRDRFDGRSIDDGRPWLFGIAKHLLVDYCRDGAIERRAMQRIEFERVRLTREDIVEIERFADLDEIRTAVSEALDLLTPAQREVVWLRVVEGLEYCEISTRLNLSEPTVRARVSRGLRQLRSKLSEGQEWEAIRAYG